MRPIKLSPPLPEKIAKALPKLSFLNRHIAIYIVGGWLRDKLRGKISPDLDLIIFNYPANKFAEKLARILRARIIKLDDFNQIYRLILIDKNNRQQIDISQAKGKNIKDDLARRDFSVNALALKIAPAGSSLIDFNNGVNDINRGIIRLISPQGFVADPVRMLRAFRFVAQLNYRLEKNTYQKIKKYARRIKESAAERITEEFCRILSSNHSAPIIELIYEAGLLEEIIPEVRTMKKSARRYYFHPRGLWQHTYQTLESLEYFLLKRKKMNFPEISPTELLALKLAALLHDVGKPLTRKVITGRVRFLGHEKYGEKLAGATLQSLRFSKQVIHLVQKLIRYHMRPINLSSSGAITARAAWRLYHDTGPAFPLLLLLALADCYSYRHLPVFQPEQFHQQLTTIHQLLNYYKKFTAPAQPKLVDGYLVMRKFNLSPGPMVGKILRMVAEAQATGKIRTTAEAIDYIRKKRII